MKRKEVDGKICQQNRCYHCCLETEMILTKKDIMRIHRKLSLSPKTFCIIDNKGFRILKNKDINGEKRCYFLNDKNLCSIYEYRPDGCRYYPIIWDLESHEALADDYCPYFKQFDSKIHIVEKELEMFIFKIFGRI